MGRESRTCPCCHQKLKPVHTPKELADLLRAKGDKRPAGGVRLPLAVADRIACILEDLAARTEG